MPSSQYIPNDVHQYDDQEYINWQAEQQFDDERHAWDVNPEAVEQDGEPCEYDADELVQRTENIASAWLLLLVLEHPSLKAETCPRPH